MKNRQSLEKTGLISIYLSHPIICFESKQEEKRKIAPTFFLSLFAIVIRVEKINQKDMIDFIFF